MSRPFPRRKVAAAAIILLLLLLIAWWLFSRKDAPPASASMPLAEFGAPRPINSIALCPGLQIVTAISQTDGDYESIKTIESVSPDSVRIKYSSEARNGDVFSDEYGKLSRMTVYRNLRREDLENGVFYVQRFFEGMPEIIPESTAIGTSAAVLRDLKSGVSGVKLNISNAYSGEPGIDRDVRPSIYDYTSYGEAKQIPGEPVIVLVDDELAILPTVKARVEFVSDAAEFVFLDDPGNPLTLAFSIGIRPDGHKTETLGVTKIAHICEPAAEKDKAPAPDISSQLASVGRVAVYDIHFAFGTDEIRDESEPRLKEIAGALNANPGWRLKVEGHTDTIGEAAANLALSIKRAEAVKAALVTRHQIDAARLETGGFGAEKPRAANETVEGRARNRRIELQRL